MVNSKLYNTKTPVVLTVWKNLTAISKVIEVIYQVQPPLLYCIVDKGRNKKEQQAIDRSIEIINSYKWKSPVKFDISKQNQGPKIRISTGLNNFFNKEKEGIILEHDCLPDPSFFYFCDQLLEKYRDTPEVMHISGNCFIPESMRTKDSYYFSHIPHIWGFATWKRAWAENDVNLQQLDEFTESKKITKIFRHKHHQEYWLKIFKQVQQNKIDTWDYQWTFSLLKNQGYSITPNQNLVKNIGFGSLAENMKDESHQFANMDLESIQKIKHPEAIEPFERADAFTMNQNFQASYFNIWFKPYLYRIYGVLLFLTNRKKYLKMRG